jgi:hypothetical protein
MPIRRAVSDDIVAAIDALIDEQLEEGETWREQSLYCPHCDRDWHGFPLTKQVAAMYLRGLFDEDYKVGEDDSAVLCPGSDVYGPVPEEAVKTMDFYDLHQIARFMGVDPRVVAYSITVNLNSQGCE